MWTTLLCQKYLQDSRIWQCGLFDGCVAIGNEQRRDLVGEVRSRLRQVLAVFEVWCWHRTHRSQDDHQTCQQEDKTAGLHLGYNQSVLLWI